MSTIKPKQGEHPLATKARELHQQLSASYWLLAFASVLIGINTAGGTPWRIVGAVADLLITGLFVVLALAERRWSR